MKTRTLQVALLPHLLTLALPGAALAQEGAVWTSINGGTLGTSTVTTTGFSSGSAILPTDLTQSEFSFAPLSATQDCANYHSFDDWSADFSPAIAGGVLWYGSSIRGGGAFPPAGSNVEYTFNHTPVIVSGFSEGNVTGNTFAVPGTGLHWGILMFSGSIDTLSCTTNSTGISFQSCDLGTLPALPPIGTNDCTAVANSTGAFGSMSAAGSHVAADNDLTLTASNLPSNQFGIFVTSRTQGFLPGANGTSNGNLCLIGTLGRFSAAGQILNSGAAGTFSLVADTTQIPEGGAFATILAGDTWNFQVWHRDGVGIGSNFTDGFEIMFQ